MKRCQTCRGLVPESLSACPNCAATARRTGVAAVATVGLMTLISSGCSEPVAVYGAPCTGKLPDGGTSCGLSLDCNVQPDGSDPTKDPNSPCYVKPNGGGN